MNDLQRLYRHEEPIRDKVESLKFVEAPTVKQGIPKFYKIYLGMISGVCLSAVGSFTYWH